MLEYAHMLHVSYYAQNYAGIIHQGLIPLGIAQMVCNGKCICIHNYTAGKFKHAQTVLYTHNYISDVIKLILCNLMYIYLNR